MFRKPADDFRATMVGQLGRKQLIALCSTRSTATGVLGLLVFAGVPVVLKFLKFQSCPENVRNFNVVLKFWSVCENVLKFTVAVVYST